MHGIYHSADSDNPWEDVNYPALFCVVAQGFYKGTVCVLLTLGRH
jgi:hypothetical protein